MRSVGVGLSMSLDGFIAGSNGNPEQRLGEGGERLFGWYFGGDVEYTLPSGTMTVMVTPDSAGYLDEANATVGALEMGRTTFDPTHGWGGRHPLDVPVFIVTHNIPEEWANDGDPFTFVTDGVESAVAQAQAAAGEKNVGVGAASIAQQCLNAGLLDEIHIDLAPCLLGGGVRLFEHLDIEPTELELTRLVNAPGVTHITYRIVK